MINMTDYKMIYKGGVYNCLSMSYHTDWVGEEDPRILKVVGMQVIFINSENRVDVAVGETKDFQFVVK